MIHLISRYIYCTYSLYDNTLLYTHILYIYCLFRFPYLNNKRRYTRFFIQKIITKRTYRCIRYTNILLSTRRCQWRARLTVKHAV